MGSQKVYTKIGDHGKTFLADGSEIKKSHLRLDAYGTVDELNAVVAQFKEQIFFFTKNQADFKNMRVQLEVIQNELFEIGSELACFAVKKGSEFSLGLESIQRLEKEMDTYSRTLKELKNFVLPGGHLANTGGHLARCVCRRAERLILKLDEIDPVRSEIKIFINRLSDWFFIATRVVTQVSESPEIIWQLRS